MAVRKTAFTLALVSGLVLILTGCLTPTPSPTRTPGPSATLSPTVSETPTRAVPSTRTITPSSTYDPQRPWGSYPGLAAHQTPATAVPTPVDALARPDEARVLVLLGTDRKAPFVSRTDAIQLILYHPRLSRASLISLPPDMLVFIPGYNMQRLQVAYAVGGWFGLADTLQYNFGIRPNHYVLVHIDEFTRFIDTQLGGLDVTSLQAYADPKFCGGIPTGTFHMNGEQLLCYIRFRDGADEADRNRRQQEVFNLILLRMVQSGNLAHLPELYKAFRQTVETDLQLPDLLDSIPLALKLGDTKRFSFYHFGPDELEQWKIPEDLSPSVFLPKQNSIRSMLTDAMNFIQTPAPLSEVIRTYEAALTIVPSPTNSLTPSMTPTRTVTRKATASLTATRTSAASLTPTPTYTPTGPTPSGYQGP